MKKYILLSCVFFVSIAVKSQELIISKKEGQFVYNVSEKKLLETSQNKVSTISENTTYIDQISYYPNQIDKNLIVTPEFDFFQGVQNPFNANVFVYMERKQIGASFNVKIFDRSTGLTQELLSVENSSRQKMAFKPIAWTNNTNEVFFEGLYLDSAEEHEGIWGFNLLTKTFSKVEVPAKYMRTPLLSPDRNSFYFLGTLDSNIDILHGNTDVVFEYNINNNSLKTITKSKGNSLVINGWKSQTNNTNYSAAQYRASALEYFLPWDFGTDLCVSRHGTPAPVGSHINQGQCGFFTNAGGHHGYAAVDFATSQNSNDNVRASAAGTVSFAGISGSLTSGYGRLVIILHSDGTRTYYAHNSSILVSENQTVTKGQIIAREGTTGGSTGDHIHFEWRAAGGNASTIGTFTGIGQPRQDFIYRSNNSTAVNNLPVAVFPTSNATNVGLPITFTHTSPVNATSFRIQVSTANTGWNNTDGFTSATSPTASVVVNASITGLNFLWAEGVAGIFEGPKASKTYYYTIRSYDATTGTSKYTTVKSFTTKLGVQPIAPINAATVASPVNLSWTSTTSGASYRLQISKVNTGWTAANGFTTATTTSANLPVNYSAAGLVNYAWPNSGTTAANLPIAGTTYYWTVRLYSSATGSSEYTPVRKFTVGSAARIAQPIVNDLYIYPNPSRGEIDLTFNTKADVVEINIFNLSGNLVMSKKYKTIVGLNTITEKSLSLSAGQYILILNDGEKISSENLIIRY